ncbi:MAG: bifunctional nuclease domain-containing protein [Nitrospinota bacterium]
MNHMVELLVKKVLLVRVKRKRQNEFFLAVVNEPETRYLMLPLGLPQAMIAAGLVRLKRRPRPLTHDLLLSVIRAGESSIEGIQLDVRENGEVVGLLDLKGKKEEQLLLPCHPFDAVVVGLLTGVPVLVEQELLSDVDRSGEGEEVPISERTEDQAEILSGPELVHWLRRVRPKDFE